MDILWYCKCKIDTSEHETNREKSRWGEGASNLPWITQQFFFLLTKLSKQKRTTQQIHQQQIIRVTTQNCTMTINRVLCHKIHIFPIETRSMDHEKSAQINNASTSPQN